MNAPTYPVASRSRHLGRVGRAGLALAVLAVGSAPFGCIIVDNSTPSSQYSPEDLEVTQPSSPAIDAHFDQVFHNVACTPGYAGGISTWSVAVDGTTQSSGEVGCQESPGNPFIVSLENLRGDTEYTLTATGYTAGHQSCYVAACTAHTMPGAHAVLPTCSVTKTC